MLSNPLKATFKRHILIVLLLLYFAVVGYYWFANASFKRPLLSVDVSVCDSVCDSVILSATLGLNISESRPDSGMVPMDSLWELPMSYRLGMFPMTSRDRMTS